MILQALHAYYDVLKDDPKSGVAMPGYSAAKVSHVLLLNTNGDLVDIHSLPETRSLILPEQPKRSSGINACYLCDNASYVIGQAIKDNHLHETREKFLDFQEKNLAFLQGIPGKEALALRNYLSSWQPKQAIENAVSGPRLEDLIKGNTLVFKLEGALDYIHETPEIKSAWEAFALKEVDSESDNNDKVWGQCLITGQFAPIAPIHAAIKGVNGAQTSGASLVSFNQDSFCSYGKEQNYNAPISKSAAFAYTTALNHLLASENNHVRVRDMTVVFWADKRSSQKENKILAWSLDPVFVEEGDQDNKKSGRSVDPATAREARKILDCIRSGKPSEDLDVDVDLDARCCILGLGPNAARLTVRFWQVNTLRIIVEKIAQHYNDMEMVGLERWGGMVSPFWTLKALANREDAKNIPPQLEGQFLESVLTGRMYPQTLFSMALNRCRTGGEYGGVTAVRAAIIKAFLLRQNRYRKMGRELSEKEAITVSLNENHPQPAYQLGRLFSLLEKVQRDAQGPDINTTIRDRYFASASSTPGSVFPLLLNLAQHHMSKSRVGDDSGRKIRDYADPRIGDVLDRIDVFPTHLSLEEQGLFVLGYYHQNRANYTKKDKAEKEKSND